MTLSSDRYLLKREEYNALADALGERPETTITIHRLQHGLCQVYIVGNPAAFEAVVIKEPASSPVSRELMGFGRNVNALYDLLQVVPDWYCVEVATEIAQPLGQLMEQRMGMKVQYYRDMYHALRQPVVPWHHPAVRQLAPGDVPLLEAAPPEVRGAGFENTRAMLRDGLAAAAIVEGRVVAIAHTSARSRDYADIGVATLEPWRKQGMSSAAASLVARKIQEAGQVPVWSTGEDNYASLRVAEKLGFTREAVLTYIILDEKR